MNDERENGECAMRSTSVQQLGCTVLLVVAGLLLLRIGAAVVSAMINRSLPTGSQVVDRLSDQEKARLAEVFHLRQTLGDTVWPGWGQADIPVILYNEEYAFLVGYPDPPSGWAKVPGRDRRGGPWEMVPNDTFEGRPYYRQRLPAPDATPEAFTVLVGEQWVASMSTREWARISLMNQIREDLLPLLKQIFPYRLALGVYSSDRHIIAVLHESFHAYAGMVAPERMAEAEMAARRDEARYPWDDPALQNAWQVELDLLARALHATSDEEAAELTRQFLAQRAQRREGHNLSVASVDYERQREWLEGLAKYVELVVCREAATGPDYEPSSALADDPDFEGYATFERRWFQEVGQMRRMADDEGDGRFCYSGIAQAVLLDRLLPGWRSQAMDELVFLEDLLRAAVATPKPAIGPSYCNEAGLAGHTMPARIGSKDYEPV